jgi:ribosomal protein L37E
MSRKEKVNWDKLIAVLNKQEKDENPEEKVVCKTCGNDTFRVYITTIIDDARLYCTKCGKDPEE